LRPRCQAKKHETFGLTSNVDESHRGFENAGPHLMKTIIWPVAKRTGEEVAGASFHNTKQLTLPRSDISKREEFDGQLQESRHSRRGPG
jgi:BMFP domain-containing protein YqiC